MTCDQAHAILDAYVDDELDLATAVDLQNHLDTCEQCARKFDSLLAIRTAISQPAVYFPAPAKLRSQLQHAIRAEIPTNPALTKTTMMMWWARPMALSGLAAAVLLVVSTLFLFLPANRSSGQLDDLVSAHVRSLEANHLLDVESTDQHTVKPWFEGKLEFSPPVIDLADQGFPLIGGRLDYFEHQKVAALIYRRNKHLINVFIWPGDVQTASDARQGFNIIRFEYQSMACCAVSDLNAQELEQFADLIKSHKSAATRP